MQISGHTRVFMILGDPVEQVRAPELFNHLFKHHNIDAVLVPAKVAPSNLSTFVHGAFAANNMGGLWATIPHKAALLPLLAHCDRRGHIAQAVNAVRRHSDGTLEGALFDGDGFVKGLDSRGVACKGSRALVVGAGGAGAAIAVSLAERGVAELALFDLNPAVSQALAQRIALAHRGTRVVAASNADPAEQDIVVNATPLGLQAQDPLAFEPQRLKYGAVVVDILMKNQPTPLVRACTERGVRAFTGFDMMICQAPAYLNFFGFSNLAAVIENDPSEIHRLFEQH